MTVTKEQENPIEKLVSKLSDLKAASKVDSEAIKQQEQDQEEQEEDQDDEVESNTTATSQTSNPKKKKKNKKKKKKSDGPVSVKTALQQTEPPSVPVCKMYMNEVYPGT